MMACEKQDGEYTRACEAVRMDSVDPQRKTSAHSNGSETLLGCLPAPVYSYLDNSFCLCLASGSDVHSQVSLELDATSARRTLSPLLFSESIENNTGGSNAAHAMAAFCGQQA